MLFLNAALSMKLINCLFKHRGVSLDRRVFTSGDKDDHCHRQQLPAEQRILLLLVHRTGWRLSRRTVSASQILQADTANSVRIVSLHVMGLNNSS